MNGKQRFQAATLGQPVDRVPIWLREGFDFHLPLPEKDSFHAGWKLDPAYRDLFEYAREFCDMRGSWSPGAHFNRALGIDPRLMRARSEQLGPDRTRRIAEIETPRGVLTSVSESTRGVNTAWQIKHFVESIDDLNALRALPFEVAPVNYATLDKAIAEMGDRGVICLGLSSPWVAFSTTMSFEQALAWSAIENELVHETLEEITQRYLRCLEAIFSRPLDVMVNIGGSEQCTPQMMSPDAYAEFVTPYDGRLVAFLKERGVAVGCHCHGRVSRALTEMVRAGFDSTDPVEPPFGGGDISIADARALVGDRLTLCGNLQFDELERSTPERIRARVREIIDTGKRRLILTASAGPISRLTPRMIENYRAWVGEAVQYGQCNGKD